MLGCQHLRPFLFRVCTQQRLTTSAQSVLHQNTATKAKDSFDQATPTSEIKLISYDHELTSIYMKRLRQWHRYDKSEKVSVFSRGVESCFLFFFSFFFFIIHQKY
eukprot:TRINITY_DN5742_c0_g1_i6.p1 TRINITY_DN5742_c0_g1~~TRINITY_DN5742_c0_g1_i6.p1  ORF type:complete len:105 (-),score=2.68 TRINITY_DN5742_c0_g1_i6:429-743(-)